MSSSASDSPRDANPTDDQTAAFRCPFLGEAVEKSTLICLADVEPVAVSQRYGDSYCLSDQHVYCSLYIAGLSGERKLSSGVYAAVEMARLRSESPELAADTHADEGTIVETRLAAPEMAADPDEAAAMAIDLSAQVQHLGAQLKASRENNSVLARRVSMLREMAENPGFLRHALATPPGLPIEDEEMEAIQALLASLLRNPQDVLALAALSQRTGRLGQIVNAYARINAMLEEQ